VELINTFDVAAAPDIAWQTVGDLEQVAMCLPGATIESRDGDAYHGRVAIKVGPISMGLGGVATVVGRDDTDRTMTVRIQAEDTSGQGTVEATMVVSASPSPAGTSITIATTMHLGGKVAQFSSGLITQVSGRIVKQVAKRIGALVDESSAASSVPHAAPTAPTARPRPAPSVITQLVAVAIAGLLLGWSLGRSLGSTR